MHDFPTDAEGKAIPYGVYDMARNEAWVSVGWDHDTPAFAVASIRQWWRQMGCEELTGVADDEEQRIADQCECSGDGGIRGGNVTLEKISRVPSSMRRWHVHVEQSTED